ncbi:NAD-dependent epimerase/dehydratase family protein [Chloroflexota bacterium]
MNVLVLGGTGMYGRKTVLKLLQDKDVSKVVSMDISPPKEWFMKQIEKEKDRFHFIRGDVSQLEDITNAIKLFSVDKLVNWAFLLPGEAELNPLTSTKINALGMCNSFEAARITGISRVVYASSSGVYGAQDEYGDRDVTEDDKLHPGSGYALMKQYSEILADQYARLYGMNLTALRPVIGCGHEGWPKGPPPIRWFSEIVSFPAQGKPFTIDMDGTNKASLAPADDVAEITRLLLHMDSSPHPAYIVGGPTTTLQDIAISVRKYIPEATIEFGNQAPPVTPGRGVVTRVSMDRAREDLGFSMLSLDEAVLIHINDARLEIGLEPIKA